MAVRELVAVPQLAGFGGPHSGDTGSSDADSGDRGSGRAGSGVDDLLLALSAALAGTGPAIAPVPTDSPEAPAILRMLATDQPLEDPTVAVVLPTSGSTGEPKGALLTADALRASATATLDRLGGPGRWLLALPTTRIAGLQIAVRALVTDHPVVPLPGPFSVETFCAATRRLGPGRRYTSLVPTQALRLLDAGSAAVEALASYDTVLVGGAAIPPELRRRCAEAGVRMLSTYGMTETAGGCVYDGFPLSGVRVAFTTDGRIRLGGPTVFSGYRLRPDLTASALVDGWHETADLGRWGDDGRLRVVGRLDDVVVSGGVNVPLLAVEHAVANHPDVAEAAAVGVPDPEWGTRVVVHVVLAAGAPTPSLDAVRDLVAESHPRSYAPRQLVVTPTLPLLPSGKLDRATLRDRPIPDAP